MERAMAATDQMALEAAAERRPTERRRGAPGPDRLTVVIFSIAALLAVLAVLAAQLRASASHAPARPVIVLRRLYRTTVIETVGGRSGAGGTSVSQSVSSSGSASASAAPTTRPS